jgi:FixJ family two-component response regulator
MTNPTVVIVDDDASCRNTFIHAFKLNGYETLAFSSAEEFLATVPPVHGCILLDVKMPGMSGFKLQQLLINRDVILPVIFLTGYADIPSTVAAMKLGASNFLTKPVSTKALLFAVDVAISENRHRLKELLKVNDFRTRYETLTQREQEVYELIIRGLLNKQIAFKLGTTERTIKAHRQKVMSKMGAFTVQNLMQTANILGKLESSDSDE